MKRPDHPILGSTFISVPGPGQESVWDYPRPPSLQPTTRRVMVDWAGETVTPDVVGPSKRPPGTLW